MNSPRATTDESVQDDGAKSPRDGWMVQEPNCLKWYWEVDAEKRKKSIQPGDSWSSVLAWRTWPSKRVAREGYEVKDPQSGTWFSEVYVSERPTDRICFHGWETWKSRPIQEPEPGPSDPPPAVGPGLREAVGYECEVLDEAQTDGNWSEVERAVDSLRTALAGTDEDARLVEAVMKWGYISCDSHGTTHAQRGLRTALDALKAAREGAARD